jgi:hypothetical protein
MEVDMNAWWWVPIGLATWFAVAVALGMCLGPVLRHCAQAREALDPQIAPDPHVAEIQLGPASGPQYWPQAS